MKKNKMNLNKAERNHPVQQNQEEPEQQPIQLEVGGEAGKERGKEGEAPLDTIEQTLLDILEED